jgi:hypothetical protein
MGLLKKIILWGIIIIVGYILLKNLDWARLFENLIGKFLG